MADGLRLGLTIGLLLAPLGGAAAFLMTYEEYRHHFPDRGRAIRASVEVGAVTFVVFLVLSGVVGVVAMTIVR